MPQELVDLYHENTVDTLEAQTYNSIDSSDNGIYNAPLFENQWAEISLQGTSRYTYENPIKFKEGDLEISLKEIIEMKDEIKNLREEIRELKQWKDV